MVHLSAKTDPQCCAALRDCVRKLMEAVPVEEGQPGVSVQSLHDIIELGFNDAHLLGNPVLSSCQRPERYHKQGKLAVAHHDPRLPLGNSVLAQELDRYLLTYELEGGCWFMDGTLDPRGDRRGSDEMQLLRESNHFLYQDLSHQQRQHPSIDMFVHVKDKKVVIATGRRLHEV